MYVISCFLELSRNWVLCVREGYGSLAEIHQAICLILLQADRLVGFFYVRKIYLSVRRAFFPDQDSVVGRHGVIAEQLQASTDSQGRQIINVTHTALRVTCL